MGPYEESFKTKLQSLGFETMEDLARLADASPEVQKDLLDHLGELMFFCQNIANIRLGREAASEIDPAWLLQHLDWLTGRALKEDDSWEYLRIREFLSIFNHEAHRAHLERCRLHSNPEVREIYDDYR